MINVEISASAVAWYGAIVATASAIIGGLNAFRDRARVSVRFSPNMDIVPESPMYPDAPYLNVTIANRGRRPLTVASVSFTESRSGKEGGLLLGDSAVPGGKELTEGKSLSCLCIQKGLDLERYRYICVSTTAGWRYRQRIPPSVRAEVQESQQRREGVQGRRP